MAKMTQVECRCCGKKFSARAADVKRGWGKYCSKRCKAVEQTKRTGKAKPKAFRPHRVSTLNDDYYPHNVWDDEHGIR